MKTKRDLEKLLSKFKNNYKNRILIRYIHDEISEIEKEISYLQENNILISESKFCFSSSSIIFFKSAYVFNIIIPYCLLNINFFNSIVSFRAPLLFITKVFFLASSFGCSDNPL